MHFKRKVNECTRLHTFSKPAYTQRKHGGCAHNDSSTKQTAPTPALGLNTNNSCGLLETHGAETLLFLMFAANMSTHTHTHRTSHIHRGVATASDTHTALGCVFLTRQTSRSYLDCLPVCLPTVFFFSSVLLLLCLGLCFK